jgi:hypothetical protein
LEYTQPSDTRAGFASITNDFQKAQRHESAFATPPQPGSFYHTIFIGREVLTELARIERIRTEDARANGLQPSNSSDRCRRPS